MFLFVAIFLGDTCTEFLIWSSVFFPSNLSQNWANTPELLGRISTSELDPQLGKIFIKKKTLGALPITLVSLTLIPSLFACFYEFVSCLGLPHAHSFSVCLFLWVCVVCVCFLLYMSVYLCAARCVFRVLFHLHNHLLEFWNIQIYDCCCAHNLVYMTLFPSKEQK